MLVITTFVASACGGGAPSEPKGTAQLEQTEITFIADWLPWAATGPMWSALENGYYADEGLTVRIIAPAEGSDPPKLVAAGKAEFAIGDVPVVIQARLEGIPIVAIGATFRELPNALFANPGSGIDGPEDLQGKTLAIPPFPDPLAYTHTMLASVGLTTDDVKIVDPGFGAMKLLLEEKVDVGHGFTFYEGTLYRLEAGERPIALKFTDYGVPAFYGQLIVANEDWLRNHPNTAGAFLRATIRGLEQFLKNPGQVTPLMAERNEVVPLRIQNAMAEDSLDAWTDEVTDVNGVFYQEEAVWAEAQQWMLDQGLIEQTLDPREYFTNEYLP
jgi:putative hydroxymethylpyrimidine transport system substrate-binding protein